MTKGSAKVGRHERVGSASVIAALLATAAVGSAYRPIARQWPWSALATISSFASETPALLAATQAASAWRAVRTGGVGGRLTLALNAMALLGLSGLWSDARRSADTLDAALRDAGVAEPRPLPRRTRGVLPGPLARMKYRRHSGVTYSAEHGKFGILDVWHRPALPAHGRAPVLIVVHGGAWRMGDKSQGSPLMGYFAERGWVCVSVNYRLAPADRWPAMIIDVKRAIAWTRQNVAGYGGDPSFIAITGGSAGGHLAALAALTPNDPGYQPGFAEADTSIAAAATLYGVYELCMNSQGLWKLLEDDVFGSTYAVDAPTWERASPIRRITAEAPPFFVVHGSTDAIVGVDQSRRFSDELRAKSSAPTGYAELPHAQHGFDALPSVRAAHAIEALFRFLQSTYESTASATDNRSIAAH